MLQKFEAGEFISFTYNPPAPPPKKTGPTIKKQIIKQPDGSVKHVNVLVPPKAEPPLPPSDKSKQILVLHPNWQGKVHGIDLSRITPAEVQTLKAVMDPNVKAQIDAGKWPVEGAPPYPLVRDILKRMDPIELIKNPLAFYQRLIKPFIRNKDCYRLYFPQFISGVQVIKESSVQGQVMNPKPLFHK